MKKIARLANFFKKSRLDALFLASHEQPSANMLYFSGSFLDNSVFMARRDGECALLVNTINESEAKEYSGPDVQVFKDSQDLWKKIKKMLFGCRSVALDCASMSAKSYLEAKRNLREKRLFDASNEMLGLRGTKDSQELQLIRKSARIARDVIEGLVIKEGKTELELAKELKIAAIEREAGLSFEPIVLSGKNTAMPHGKPSNKKVARGDVVLIDFGVKKQNYCSDITRCFFFGNCKEERENYEKLKRVFSELVREAKAGQQCSGIQKRCELLMKKSGFGPMIHSPGHGIGLEVHENPSFSKKSKDKLVFGMALAIEPAIYLPGKYGLRYEDDVVVWKERARVV
ncbi:MAG: M24 family metallopeptidase [Candidatus Micrarchaeota archaeon]